MNQDTALKWAMPSLLIDVSEPRKNLYFDRVHVRTENCGTLTIPFDANISIILIILIVTIYK